MEIKNFRHELTWIICKNIAKMYRLWAKLHGNKIASKNNFCHPVSYYKFCHNWRELGNQKQSCCAKCCCRSAFTCCTHLCHQENPIQGEVPFWEVRAWIIVYYKYFISQGWERTWWIAQTRNITVVAKKGIAAFHETDFKKVTMNNNFAILREVIP